MRSTRRGSGGGALLAVEEHDRQAVELVVGGLRHDAFHDLEVGIRAQPARDALAELLALLCLRGREDLHPGEPHAAASLTPAHATTPRARPPSMARRFSSCQNFAAQIG